jgi:hypothetical protein
MTMGRCSAELTILRGLLLSIKQEFDQRGEPDQFDHFHYAIELGWDEILTNPVITVTNRGEEEAQFYSVDEALEFIFDTYKEIAGEGSKKST